MRPGQQFLRYGLLLSLTSLGSLISFAWTAPPPVKMADYATNRYATGTPDDVVSRLQRRVESGECRLEHDSKLGYLPAVLKALEVPISSQTLVFSGTSVQKELISPQHPRALYFNDRVYVGYVPDGRVLEIAAIDPRLGPIYYNLFQAEREKPRFVRNVPQCMECHGAKTPEQIPLLRMLSVYPDPEGVPIEEAPGGVERDTTDATPFSERWGGWYVTGTYGKLRHMGNSTAARCVRPISLDRERGANITDLHPLFDTSPYLSDKSDIVALMLLAHQTHAQNLITQANYATNLALPTQPHLRSGVQQNRVQQNRVQQKSSIGSASGTGKSATMAQLTPEVRSRIGSACEPLLRAMLFVGEYPLTAPLVGTSGITAEFATTGPRDPKGRSLRDLDLKRRLFRYPCSYLIYSDSFNALPAPAKEYLYRRLWEVLSSKDRQPAFAHLSASDRKAINEILLATKPNFAAAHSASKP